MIYTGIIFTRYGTYDFLDKQSTERKKTAKMSVIKECRARAARHRSAILKSCEVGVECALGYAMVTVLIGVGDVGRIGFAYPSTYIYSTKIILTILFNLIFMVCK